MYKIIIVDDEDIVRDGIKRRLNWEELGFRVVGDAVNGQEALKLAEQEIPDVILTDIRMPIMDGMELIRILSQKIPAAKVVVLTGHEEFEYAHQSIKYGVLDYILKPVSATELSNVMLKVKEMLDHKLNNELELENLKNQIKQSLPILRDRFLNDLIFTSLNETEIYEKKEFLGVNFVGEYFAVLVAEIDNYKMITEHYREEQKQLLKFSVYNIVQDVTSLYPHSIAFIAHDDYITIIMGFVQDKESNKESLNGFTEEIRNGVEKNLRITVSIGVGNIYQGLVQLRSSFREALTALEYKFLLGKNNTFFFSDNHFDHNQIDFYPSDLEKQLLTQIKLGNKTEAKHYLDQLLAQFMQPKNATWGNIQIVSNQILTMILKLMQEMKIEFQEAFGSDIKPYQEILKYETLPDLKTWLEGIVDHLCDQLMGKRSNRNKSLIDKAKQYIDQHYQNPGLALNEVASQVNISVCYFSILFKEGIGESFQDYLIRIRLERAKELLRTSDLKTYEIAYQVGYSDPHYFGVAFKKYVGVTPTEYKDIK